MATLTHAPSALLDLFDRIDTRTITRDYQDKQAIFSQGDRADALFYIRSGYVKLTVKSKGGKKAIVAILQAGDFFGEGCITKASSRMSSATAIEPCTIARVTRANITHRIQEPAFAKLLVAHLLLRLERIEDEFVDQIFSSSEKRLARILLLLAGFQKKLQPAPVVLKVNQETLAEMVGTTRSRVSYFMNRFRELGYIDYNGTIKVHPSLLTFLQNK